MLLYALAAAITLWGWTAPPLVTTSRPADTLAVFDVQPTSRDTLAPQHKTAQERASSRPAETPRPTSPIPPVRLPARSTAQTEPAAPTIQSKPDGTDQSASATVPASAVPAVAPPTSGRTASAERAAQANWQGDILAHLRPLLRYPRMAERDGQQGIALVAIGVDRQGMVRSARIARGSGYPLLDAEALATVKRGSPLPAPTADIPGDPVSVELPIQFSLHG
jgi:protein TonB